MSWDRRDALIGASIPRVHDERLLRGDGWYVDDIDDAGVLQLAFVRSPVAHGRINRFDATAAVADGEAILVLGPDEVAELTNPLPTSWRIPGQHLDVVEPAIRTVRYVGQPIGLVVARSRAIAEDVAELVEVDIDPLPLVAGIDAALAEGAPLVYPEIGTNVAGEIYFGDPVKDLEEAFAAAPHVVERVFGVQRVCHSPMEPRGVLAEWIPSVGQMTVWISTQIPHVVRRGLGVSLGLRADQIRVVTPDVGGAFGGKAVLYVDETLVCLAAKVLGRRVKWIEDRVENLTASYQGRGQQAHARLALDSDGRFLAIYAHIRGDLGAFPTQAGSGPFQVAGLTLEGPYRFGCAGSTVTAVYTNAVPTGAYRGYGMPESSWIRERLIDEAARELGMDPVRLRLRNMIQSDELPHTTHTGLTYDSGDYPAALRRAAELADAHRRRSTDRIRRGIAVTAAVEVTGFAPSALLEAFAIDWSGWESGRIRINEDGTITVFSGVVSIGQGVETTLAQIVADQLGVPMDWVTVQLGDTATAPYSDLSSQASRSLTLAGAALLLAGARMRERMYGLAAAYLGVAVEDVKLDGTVFLAGTAQTSVTWREVAHRGWMGWGRAEPDRIQLEEVVDFDPPAITFAYSAHGAAVAVDLDTGTVSVEDYWSVNDSGVLVNPLIAEGQIVGAIAQGLGVALHEEVVFDAATARPATTTYTEYHLPRSRDVPEVIVEHRSTPSTVNPGGFKGLGEGGTMLPPVTIANAIAEAVPEIAAGLNATPLSPQRIWDLLEAAGLVR